MSTLARRRNNPVAEMLAWLEADQPFELRVPVDSDPSATRKIPVQRVEATEK